MAENEDGYEGVTVAGIAVIRRDGGASVFLAQRTLDETDDPDVRETWEFPGGHLNEGEDPLTAAKREFAEEVGFELPEGEVTGGWRSEDGHYQGFVFEPRSFPATKDWTPTSEVQAVGWFDREDIEALGDALRPEVRKQMDWSLVFTEENVSAAGWCAPSDNLTELAVSEDDDLGDFDELDFGDEPIPFHGVLVAFDVETGDRRVIPSAGEFRNREFPIPVMYQKRTDKGHGQSQMVGAIHRLERDDEAGVLRYEGYFADTDLTDEVVGLITDFTKLGISADLDDVREVRHDEESGITVFADSRAAGATIVSIGAFAEAYIALGRLDDPVEPEQIEESFSLGDGWGADSTFARGPGWVTNPRETSRLHRYWISGPGAAKIRWNTPGDFYRCRRLVGAKIAKNSPEKLRFINQICAQWHKDATGVWTGDRRNPGNRRASAFTEELNLTASGIGALPAEWFDEPEQPKMTFTYDEATGMTRVSGMVAEWRRCHLGYGNKCVTPPRGSGSYRLFLKGEIETTKGTQRVGTLTFGTGHAGLKVSASEAAAHYDNTGRVWAFVNVGENNQGIWYSGVVNPELSAQTVWTLKAGGAVSGDWRAYEGRSEMIAALSVNVPGFPQPLVAAAFGEDEELLAMTAAGIVLPDREERIELLRSFANQQVRLSRIDHLKELSRKAL